MTIEQAMAAVAVELHRLHVRDNQFHGSVTGPRCGRCDTLGEAAATLQEAATASIGLAREVR